MKKNNRATIITGVIGSDCHAVGNRIIEMFFSSAGYKVVNLGVMVAPDEFVAAAVETSACAILVSSLYGHGELDCRGLREKCVEAGIGDILLYIGGNLVIGAAPFEKVEEKFQNMGFDRVFSSDMELEYALDCLNQDLKSRGVL